MVSRFFLFLILLTIIFPALNAQNIESWIETNDKVPVEKIYVHTDREYYFSGETIWLKSYLTDSRSGRLIPGAENIYLRLIDGDGETVIKTNLMSIHGQVSGHFNLPDTLNPGNYILQAFTDYLLNFDAGAFFYKKIGVSRTARSLRALESRAQTGTARKMVADVAFLPEGGKMLERVPNLLAFKAIDQNGYGIEARGTVRDETGAEVLSFKTDYKGMGIFFLTPEPEKSYYSSIDGFPSFRFGFDSIIVSEGIKIQVVNHTSKELILNISSNSEKFTGEPFYLVNRFRGSTVFYQPFKMEDKTQLLKFESNMLKGGINQLMLLDKNLRPVSERMIFSDNFNLLSIDLKTSSEEFDIRSEVELGLTNTVPLDETSNLSVAVVHENAFPENGFSTNILSSLLIDSELKGFIEDPSDYFTDTEISAQTKQRLLMLTNGWSNYLWNFIPDGNTPLANKQKAGLDLSGIAKETTTGRPLNKGEITLILEKDREMAILTQNTDEEGKFTFTGLLFNDTANVYVQARNEKGRQNTEIVLIPSIEVPESTSWTASAKGNQLFMENLEKQKYDQELTWSNYLRRQGTLNSGQKKVQTDFLSITDGHFRMYDRADQVIEIPETEASFGNILDFLAGKVAGLDISGNNVALRGTSNFDRNSAPLFLVDGIPLITTEFVNLPAEIGINVETESVEGSRNAVEKIKSIPLNDIEKVEILKSPQNLALFGVEGANGVIAIYTRQGKTGVSSAIPRGVIEQKITGYASFRKFYSPKHLPEFNYSEKPDFRTTLFWEPEIVLQNGPAELSFFTSDQTGKYKVIVEGISESGRICIGSAEIEVIGKTEN